MWEELELINLLEEIQPPKLVVMFDPIDLAFTPIEYDHAHADLMDELLTSLLESDDFFFTEEDLYSF